jgi:large subunit ribosomal protein L5
MNRLQKKYYQEVIPKMKEIFGYKNNLCVPRLEKVVINVGAGRALQESDFLDIVGDTLGRITGQKAVLTKAKRSISNFKIRQGLAIGTMVTLRGRRMYDFIDKLISITLPRIRDFRGLDPKSIDNLGNCSIGIREHNVFPEIRSDEVEKLFCLEVAIATTATNKKEGLQLLKLLGFPFKEEESK